MQYIKRDDIINATLEHEGTSFVHDPVDRGGATKYGITLDTYRTVFPLATVDTIKNLTRVDAVYFYTKFIYNKYKLDAIPSSIRDVYFDMIVNHGPGTAAKLVQKVVNQNIDKPIPVDGVVGPKTLYQIALVDQRNPTALRQQLIDRRNVFYDRIVDSNPTQKKFINGWKTRSNSFTI